MSDSRRYAWISHRKVLPPVSRQASDATRFARPALNFPPEPQSWAPTAAVDDGSRHVLVAAEVRGHAGDVAQPKKIGDIPGVNQVLGIDARGHIFSLMDLTRRKTLG